MSEIETMFEAGYIPVSSLDDYDDIIKRQDDEITKLKRQRDLAVMHYKSCTRQFGIVPNGESGKAMWMIWQGQLEQTALELIREIEAEGAS